MLRDVLGKIGLRPPTEEESELAQAAAADPLVGNGNGSSGGGAPVHIAFELTPPPAFPAPASRAGDGQTGESPAWRARARRGAAVETNAPDRARGLVWPGKTQRLGIVNSDVAPLLYRAAVNGLPRSYYVLRIARVTGSAEMRHPVANAGFEGVLLRPGERAEVEVSFSEPPEGDVARGLPFDIVITRADPAWQGQTPDTVQEVALRWVGLPAAEDFHLTAAPGVIVVRPWHRTMTLDVRLEQQSQLPPHVALRIEQADTREELREPGSAAATIEQQLPANTGGHWRCELPVSAGCHPSHFIDVIGDVQIPGGAKPRTIALDHPVSVCYVPWLRSPKDWLAAGAALLALSWLVFGVPVLKQPRVHVALRFAGLPVGALPPDVRAQDLTADLVLLDDQQRPMQGVAGYPGVPSGDGFDFNGPTRWYGYRLPGAGWTWLHSRPQRYAISLTAAPTVAAALQRYDLSGLMAPASGGVIDISQARPGPGDWREQASVTVPAAPTVEVDITLKSLGALARRGVRMVRVSYTVNGDPQPAKLLSTVADASGHVAALPIDLTSKVPLGQTALLTVSATAQGVASVPTPPLSVRRQDAPYTIAIAFPDHLPRAESLTADGSTGAGGDLAAAKELADARAAAAQAEAAAASAQLALRRAPRTVIVTVPRAPAAGRPSAAEPAHATAPLVVVESPRAAPSQIGAPARPSQVAATRPRSAAASATPAYEQKSIAAALAPKPYYPGQLNVPLIVAVHPESANRIMVHWLPVTGATRYTVARGLLRSGRPADTEEVYSGGATSFTDTRLDPGTVYTYTVRAINPRAHSEPSSVGVGRTLLVR